VANMWTCQTKQIANGRGIRVALELDSLPVHYAEVLQRWRDDADFRSVFISLLAKSPFQDFRWETPPITSATAGRAFEFVLLDSPGLAGEPDLEAFAEHFRGEAPGGVVEFPNLRRDAAMVVPCPIGPASAYGHLGAFVRHAPEAQKHEL